MTVWIVGAGAIGSAVGARLARSMDVVFIDTWAEHVDAMNERGLTVDYAGERLTVPVRALRWEHVSVAPAPDVVLVAVKSYETTAAVHLVSPFLADDTPVVSLQNGINEEVIADLVGSHRTIGAVSVLDGSLVGPAEARQVQPTGRIVIGELDGADTERVHRLADLLRTAYPTNVSYNIWGELWSKLVRNSMHNPVGAITGLPAGQLVQAPNALRLSLLLGSEAVGVAAALGHLLITDDLFGCRPEHFLAPVESTEFLMAEARFRDFYAARANLRSSMLQDILKRRPTEIDHLNGYVVRKGRTSACAISMNERVVHMVNLVAAGRRSMGEHNVTEVLTAAPIECEAR
jgi:2-dehydropantoate 2-reductase